MQPIIDQDSKILILGTVPGTESLLKGEYYANEDNIFWDVLYRIFHQAPNCDELIELEYSEKKELLLKNKIALWDVLEQCNRDGNKDSKISEERINNFADFLTIYPNIKIVVFNGEKAFKYFNKEYSHLLDNIQFKKFFSTSSSNPVNSFYILYQWAELKKLLSDGNDFYKSLSEQQKIFFDHYKSNDPYLNTEYFAYHLNDMLHKGNVDEEWDLAIKTLDEIIQLNSINERKVLFRAMKLQEFEQYINGNTLIYPAYMSTSIKAESVQAFFAQIYPPHETPIFIEIDCPPGSRMASFENSNTSELENEVLLGRNNSFKIIESKIIKDPRRISDLMSRQYAIGFAELMFYKIELILK